MHRLLKFFLTFIIIIEGANVFAFPAKYILHDKCINILHDIAEDSIHNEEIKVIRDSHGIILRFPIYDVLSEYQSLSQKTLEYLQEIGFFLAKIKNPVIIEVHTDEVSEEIVSGLKNWEVSTVIANDVESVISKTIEKLDDRKIISVGYGEFSPTKNTPYNGGIFLNRVDIIVLCNVNGE